MHVRVSRLLSCVSLGAALAWSGAVPAYDIKIATVAPEGSAWMQDMRAAAKEVGSRTGGRLSLRFYGGGIQGNDRKVLRKIRIGQLQGGAFTASGLAERYPDIALYGLPLLFDSQAEVDYVRQRMDGRLAAGLRKSGFVSFGFAGGGFAYLLTDEPASQLTDLRGKKIWVPEGDQASFAAMQALGLSPIVLPLTDVMTGLETGLLNIVASPPVGAIVLQWYTKSRYVTDQPLSYTFGVLAIDERALDRLSEADRSTLSEVMTGVYAKFDQRNRADNEKAVGVLRNNGLKFVAPAEGEVARWRASVAQATDRLVADGLLSADLLRETRGYIQEYRSRQASSAR